MARSDFITTIASRSPNLMAKDAEVAVNEILDAIGQALSQGDRIEICCFGSFSLNYRSARTGRNPKSGDSVPDAPKYVPHFKPGKDLRERVEVSAKHTQLQPAASAVAE